MATYSVRTRRYGTQTGVANGTDIVILFPFLSRQLSQRFRGWVRATRSVDDFTFFDADDVELGTVTLTRVDIRKAVTGTEVLFEATTGRWEACRIVKSGDEILAGDVPLASTTRACKVTAGQDVSALVGFLEQGGTSEDGDIWFTQAGEVVVRTDAMSTLSALAVGDIVVVETSTNKWEIVTL